MGVPLSIIIVSLNCKDLLFDCLSSIFKYQETPELEVIVVDNASTDKTTDMIKSKFPQVKLMENAINLGFAAANNMGIKNAGGDFLLLLNPDTILKQPETFATMIRFMITNPEVGIAGPKLTNADGSFQWSAGPIPSVGNMIIDKPLAAIYRYFGSRAAAKLPLVSPKYYQGYQPRAVGFVSGAAMLIRKRIFEDIGLLDEKFFMYFEDVDLCLRVKNKGWAVYYLPQVTIFHLSGQSFGEKLDLKESLYYQSQDYFFKKNKGRAEQWLLRGLRLPYKLSGLRSKINKYY